MVFQLFLMLIVSVNLFKFQKKKTKSMKTKKKFDEEKTIKAIVINVKWNVRN